MTYIVRNLYTGVVLFTGTYEACCAWAERNPPASGGCNHILPADKDVQRQALADAVKEYGAVPRYRMSKRRFKMPVRNPQRVLRWADLI